MEAPVPVASLSSSTHRRRWPGDVGGSSSSSSRSRVAGAVVRGLIAFVFATVGAVLGAVAGALIGLATESGLVRGAGVGAISGAVVSMEVVESSVAIWRSHDSGIWSVLFVLDVIWSLLTGRLVREKVDPAVQSAVESQMNAADSMVAPRTQTTLFDTSTATGMSATDIQALPSTTVSTAEEEVEVEGENTGCSVCLHDLVPGETARRLPGCAHTFHLPCIDAWLMRHASCPLCRRALC